MLLIRKFKEEIKCLIFKVHLTVNFFLKTLTVKWKCPLNSVSNTMDIYGTWYHSFDCKNVASKNVSLS